MRDNGPVMDPACINCARLLDALVARNEEAELLYKEVKLLRADIRVKDGMIAELRQKLNEASERLADGELYFEEALEERNRALEKALAERRTS